MGLLSLYRLRLARLASNLAWVATAALVLAVFRRDHTLGRLRCLLAP